MVTKLDLTDQTTHGGDAFLYSFHTFEEYSANAGDYWDLPNDHVFLDSEGNEMALVERNTIVNVLKG